MRSTWSAPAGAGPRRPEPITAGSSPGTSEMNSARAARPCKLRGQPPALDARQRGAARIELADGDALRQPRADSARCEVAERHARRSTSTRLEAPPEIRNSGSHAGGSSCDPRSRRAPAASERSSGSGMGALVESRRRQARAAAARRGRPCVMMSVRSIGSAERIVRRRAPWRRRPCRRRPPTPAPRLGGCGAQRVAHAAAAVDACRPPAAARAAAARRRDRRCARQLSVTANDLELAALARARATWPRPSARAAAARGTRASRRR